MKGESPEVRRSSVNATKILASERERRNEVAGSGKGGSWIGKGRRETMSQRVKQESATLPGERRHSLKERCCSTVAARETKNRRPPITWPRFDAAYDERAPIGWTVPPTTGSSRGRACRARLLRGWWGRDRHSTLSAKAARRRRGAWVVALRGHSIRWNAWGRKSVWRDGEANTCSLPKPEYTLESASGARGKSPPHPSLHLALDASRMHLPRTHEPRRCIKDVIGVH